MMKGVMVVSPLASFRRALEVLIQDGGYTVCAGVGSLSAFRRALDACQVSPNIILLDFWLSRSVTIDFIKGLKQQGFKVILMGTHFLAPDIAVAESLDFLEKPFTQKELLKVIQRLNS